MILLASALAFAGCGKSDKNAAQRVPATMDPSKLQQAFRSPTPAQQSSLEKVTSGIRYHLYPDTLAALDKLASDPALTEPQKKAISDLVEAIKQTMAKAPAP